MKPILLLIALLPMIGACAFKQSAADEAASALYELNGRPISAQLRWEGQKTEIVLTASSFKQRSRTAWIREESITLPPLVPDTIELELQLAIDAQELKNVRLAAVATTGDDLSERKLGAEILGSFPADFGSSLKFKIIGLKNLFLPDHEQRVFVTLEMKSPNKPDAFLALALTTPPSQIKIVERNFVFRRASIPQGLEPYKTLTSQAESRVLVEHVRLRNDSFQRVRLSIPFRTEGEHKIRGTQFRVGTAPSANSHYTLHVQEKK
ncbi:MAG: hypothetical protein AABZ55_00195, partial [Bdellovibrionota bacterium]